MMPEDLSIEELEKRAAALEQELNALRSVIAACRAQAAADEEAAAAQTAEVAEAPIASSLRLSGYLTDGSLWDIAIPFSAIGREGGVTIGRDADMADVPLPEDNVSRLHVRLEINEQGLSAVDLGSTNGSFINSRPLTPSFAYPLVDGDTLTLGTLNLRVDMLF